MIQEKPEKTQPVVAEHQKKPEKEALYSQICLCLYVCAQWAIPFYLNRRERNDWPAFRMFSFEE